MDAVLAIRVHRRGRRSTSPTNRWTRWRCRLRERLRGGERPARPAALAPPNAGGACATACTVVLVGPPNAGKSSLLNAGGQRARHRHRYRRHHPRPAAGNPAHRRRRIDPGRYRGPARCGRCDRNRRHPPCARRTGSRGSCPGAGRCPRPCRRARCAGWRRSHGRALAVAAQQGRPARRTPRLPADALYVSARTGEGLGALHARCWRASRVQGGRRRIQRPRPPPDALAAAADHLSSAADELAAERLDRRRMRWRRRTPPRADRRRQARRGWSTRSHFGDLLHRQIRFLSYPALTNVPD